MTRLGQDEYNLSYLVKSLGDFDPVDIIGDSNDAPVQSIVFVLNITKSLLMLKSKVDFSLISLLVHISASLFIRQIILQGYKFPLFILQLQLSFLTIDLLFRIVILLIKLFLIFWLTVQCSSANCAPTIVNPCLFSSSILVRRGCC